MEWLFVISCFDIVQGLLMACLNHFSTEPLSAYMATLLQQEDHALAMVGELPSDLIERSTEYLRTRKGRANATQVLEDSLAHCRAWKLGLTWTNLIATTLQKLTRSSGFTLHSLYCMSASENQQAIKLVGNAFVDPFCVWYQLLSIEESSSGAEWVSCPRTCSCELMHWHMLYRSVHFWHTIRIW